MSCATCDMRHCVGMENSPPSSCSVPFSTANSDDLPAPLRPTRPTFSPGLSVTEVLRSEEHTSELQSLMRISYAVFCLKKKKKQLTPHKTNTQRTSSLSSNTSTYE